MRALRVNADYEMELFHQKLAPQAINQSIEFFLFFLSPAPLYSVKTYSQAYLEHVAALTGRSPRVTSEKTYENFWGSLKDLGVERWWNSKLTSTRLIIDQKWCLETRILSELTHLESINWERTYLLKDPTGMSGQKFQLLSSSSTVSERQAMIEKALSSGPQILEPFFERKYDFSQYVFPDGRVVAYENLIDAKFQYKGSVLTDHTNPRLEDLPFYSLVSEENWQRFRSQSQAIMDHYALETNVAGYSIDSFVYLENGELKIRTMSEINYRRTMGRVAIELSALYAKDKWSALILSKSTPTDKPLWEILRPLEQVLVLSPGDSRFEIFFISAANFTEGKKLVERMNGLLAHTQLTVKI